MKELDNLFNEKLADHAVAPSEGAWNRIEAGLSKKNSSLTWMRWAAILVPVAIVSLFFLYKPDQAPQLARQSPKQMLPTIPVAPRVASAEPTSVIQPVAGKPNTSHKKKSTSRVVDEGNAPLQTAASVPEVMTLTAEIVIEPAVLQAPLSVVAESKPIVLVYTLDQVTSPVLPEVKRTSLGRVVEFANTVKHSDPLSDLRGMKDELLAINLRKKSTKKN